MFYHFSTKDADRHAHKTSVSMCYLDDFFTLVSKCYLDDRFTLVSKCYLDDLFNPVSMYLLDEHILLDVTPIEVLNAVSRFTCLQNDSKMAKEKLLILNQVVRNYKWNALFWTKESLI